MDLEQEAAIDFRLIGNLLCLFGHKVFPHCGNERLFTATWIQLLAFQLGPSRSLQKFLLRAD
jgi:hypothetical protein